LSEYGKLLLEYGQQHEVKTVATSYFGAEKISYTTSEESFLK
jgi:hypothetical protein